jgi:hypothetical protein
MKCPWLLLITPLYLILINPPLIIFNPSYENKTSCPFIFVTGNIKLPLKSINK